VEDINDAVIEKDEKQYTVVRDKEARGIFDTLYYLISSMTFAHKFLHCRTDTSHSVTSLSYLTSSFCLSPFLLFLDAVHLFPPCLSGDLEGVWV